MTPKTFFIACAAVLTIACSGGEARDPKTAASAETTSARTPADANKLLARHYFEEVWDQKNPDAVSKYVVADLVNHAAIPSAQGAAGLTTIIRKVQKAFPDIKMTIDSITADEDLVVVRAAFDGTQTNALEFANPIEATGKHVHIDQVHTLRVKDGKIVETWMVMDHFELMKQLGKLPQK